MDSEAHVIPNTLERARRLLEHILERNCWDNNYTSDEAVAVIVATLKKYPVLAKERFLRYTKWSRRRTCGAERLLVTCHPLSHLLIISNCNLSPLDLREMYNLYPDAISPDSQAHDQRDCRTQLRSHPLCLAYAQKESRPDIFKFLIQKFLDDHKTKLNTISLKIFSYFWELRLTRFTQSPLFLETLLCCCFHCHTGQPFVNVILNRVLRWNVPLQHFEYVANLLPPSYRSVTVTHPANTDQIAILQNTTVVTSLAWSLNMSGHDVDKLVDIVKTNTAITKLSFEVCCTSTKLPTSLRQALSDIFCCGHLEELTIRFPDHRHVAETFCAYLRQEIGCGSKLKRLLILPSGPCREGLHHLSVLLEEKKTNLCDFYIDPEFGDPYVAHSRNRNENTLPGATFFHYWRIQYHLQKNYAMALLRDSSQISKSSFVDVLCEARQELKQHEFRVQFYYDIMIECPALLCH